MHSIYFIFDGEILDDNGSTIASYGVENKSILQLLNLDATERVDFSSIGAKFVDISNNESLKKKDWSETAPPWRKARRGLCLEGLCRNNQCKAYKQYVVMPIGYRKFDIIIDSSETTTKCPLCKQYVEPITCGFNNCWWRYEGVRQDEEGKPPTRFSSNWQQADDAYHYFDGHTSRIVLWKQLIVEAVKKRPLE
ncbi:unnamed protein product [Rotaria sordida]|uniref:Ubiquitin-like domain-containing protein n=1 Tax=Rotaria sordida TaxID=392033 RepID=A0A820BRT5_9BILA|nr:unnamed protein product [Rotaria sordida]CAF1192507.1 unnamed protein product [Rotaria sordida]CAF1249237.1 unnamed protein product [Rotaria sordida]CAF1266741.1 unnamed protein product [Rotaria sordida]CAF1460085.1 unnamed protein product [Rotaria sordida]